MSAPAALAISKLTYPETETVVVTGDEYYQMEKRYRTSEFCDIRILLSLMLDFHRLKYADYI